MVAIQSRFLLLLGLCAVAMSAPTASPADSPASAPGSSPADNAPVKSDNTIAPHAPGKQVEPAHVAARQAADEHDNRVHAGNTVNDAGVEVHDHHSRQLFDIISPVHPKSNSLKSSDEVNRLYLPGGTETTRHTNQQPGSADEVDQTNTPVANIISHKNKQAQSQDTVNNMDLAKGQVKTADHKYQDSGKEDRVTGMAIPALGMGTETHTNKQNNRRATTDHVVGAGTPDAGLEYHQHDESIKPPSPPAAAPPAPPAPSPSPASNSKRLHMEEKAGYVPSTSSKRWHMGEEAAVAPRRSDELVSVGSPASGGVGYHGTADREQRRSYHH